MAKNNGNKNKKGGLYGGKAGEYAAQADPQTYFNTVLAQEGRNAHNTAPDYWDFLQNEGFSGIYGDYQSALANNERLKFKNYLRNIYGANIGRQGFPNQFSPQAQGGVATGVGNDFLNFLGR